MNSPTLYRQNILIHLQKLMDNRMELDGTTLHYLAVRQATCTTHTSSLSCHPFSLTCTHNTSRPVCVTIWCKDSGLFMKSSDTFSAKTSCWKGSRRREENRHVCKLLVFSWTD